MHGIRVIDCDVTEAFVALSYVWGSARQACEVFRTDGGHQALPEPLPAVVQDSTQVTKALGFRHLWIDTFYIDQDDPSDKHLQIRQMDRIYRNAELTIIAAAGHDESYGLPGVGIQARPRRPIITLDGARVLWSPKDPHMTITQSHSATRGWTFQEAALSRRRLVFTED